MSPVRHSLCNYSVFGLFLRDDVAVDLTYGFGKYDYCSRFYNRQFMTRKIENTDLLKKFRSLLCEYFDKGEQLSLGIPTVQYCADKLCVSANYFGDLIKKSTGDTASHYIRRYIIQQAKNMLASGESITQVAYGFGSVYKNRNFLKPVQLSRGSGPSWRNISNV